MKTGLTNGLQQAKSTASEGFNAKAKPANEGALQRRPNALPTNWVKTPTVVCIFTQTRPRGWMTLRHQAGPRVAQSRVWIWVTSFEIRDGGASEMLGEASKLLRSALRYAEERNGTLTRFEADVPDLRAFREAMREVLQFEGLQSLQVELKEKPGLPRVVSVDVANARHQIEINS